MADSAIRIVVTASGAAEASRVLAGVAAAGGQLGSITASGARQAEAALGSLGGTAKRVFEIFTGFAIGNLFIQGVERIKEFAAETARLGLAAKVQGDAFARLSESVGVAGDVLLREMNKAAGGILNAAEVTSAATKALAEGLQPDQIVNVMRIAREQAKITGATVAASFEQISNAISQQNAGTFKQFGIILDLEHAYDLYAAKLGVTADRLDAAGKTQAIYEALVKKTAAATGALSTGLLTQHEIIQGLSAQWETLKVAVGKSVVDAGFAVLDWLGRVKADVGDITPSLEQLGKVWAATWTNAKAAIEPFGVVVGGIKPVIQGVLVAIAELGVASNLVFTGMVGPVTFFGSLLDDIANKRLPDFEKANAQSVTAQTAANKQYTDSITALHALRDSFTETKAKTDDMGTSTAMGTNKLGALDHQIRALVPDLKALQSAVAGIASAFKALSDEADRGVFPEDEFTKLNAPLDAFRDKMRDQLATLGLSKGAIQQLDATLAGLQGRLVAQVTAFRDALTESKAYYAGLHDGSMSAAQSVEAGQDALEGIAAAAKAFSDARVADMLESMALALKDLSDLPEVAKLTTDLVTLNRELMALKAPTDLDAESIKRFGVSFDLLDEATKKALLSLRAIREESAKLSFADELANIDAQAKVLGPTFDDVGKKISATQAELSRLAIILKNGGDVSQAIDEANAKLAGFMGEKFQQDIRLAFGATRTVFDELVDAARGTASALHAGFSDGFFALFSGDVKSLGEVFANFGKSMLRVLTDFLASQAVKGLFKLFEWLIGGMSGSFDSGGLFGSLLAGAGALLAKFSSSSVGNAGGIGTSDIIRDTTGAVDNLTTSANGAATALDKINPGITNFQAGVSAALSAFGVGVGIYSLLQGGSPGGMALTAAGTALSLYSLAQSVSVLAFNAELIGAALPTIGTLVAQGLAAIAPELAATIGTALVNAGILTAGGTVATALGAGGAVAGTGALAGISSALTAASAAVNAFLVVWGGYVGAAAVVIASMIDSAMNPYQTLAERQGVDLTNSVQRFNAGIRDFALASNALKDLSKVGVSSFASIAHGARESAALIDAINVLMIGGGSATGLSPADRAKLHDSLLPLQQAAPQMQADAWAAFLHLADLAKKEGADITNILAGDHWGRFLDAMGDASTSAEFLSRSMSSLAAGHEIDDPNTGGNQSDQMRTRVATLADVARQQLRLGSVGKDPRAVNSDEVRLGIINASSDLASMLDGFTREFGAAWRDALTGDQGAVILARSAGNPNQPELTILQRLEQIITTMGLKIDQFTNPSDALDILQHASTVGGLRDVLVQYQQGFDLQQAAIAMGRQLGIDTVKIDLNADAIKRFHIEVGNYTQGVLDFLASIDASIVDTKMYKHFQEGGAGDPSELLKKALIANMTPGKFYDAAKVFTDKLTAEIKKALASQADMITAGADQKDIDAVGKLIAAMQEGIKAYAGLVQLYTGIPLELAAITDDLEAATKASIDAWKVSVKALGDNVAAAQTAFDEALKSGNIIAINQTAQALHDTTMAGYQMMLKAVEQINAAIKGILDKATALVQMVTAVAKWDIGAHGDFGVIGKLMSWLGDIAGIDRPGSIRKGGGIDPKLLGPRTEGTGPGIDTTRPVTATMLWAVDQAIRALIATLPTAIAKFGGMQTAADWLRTGTQTAGQLRGGAGGPSQITGAVIGAAAPFLAVQQRAIDQAKGGAKLDLLQQQASDLNNLAAAAVAGVQQWAQQAIAGARAAADEVIAGLAKERDAKLAAIDAQIASVQSAAEAEQEMRTAQMAGLQEAIQTADAMKSAWEGMAQFIQGLKVGPLGPGNPMDKLGQAQDAFAKALQAYNANPTAAGLTGLQGLAQTMLSLAEPIFSKPSPQFQALSATTIKQLEAANALAAGQASDSEVLKSQLAALVAADKAAVKGVQDQLAALEAQKKSITDDFETQTAAIEAAFATQKTAIEQAATDEITGINDGLAAALKANFEKQVPLLEAQYNAAQAQLTAIGDTKVWQDATRGILQGIYDKLAIAIPSAATGAEIEKGGLINVHAGERILSATEAAALDPDLNNWNSIYSQPRDLSKEGVAWGGPKAAELNRLELTIRQLTVQFESTLAHNIGKIGGQIRRNFSDAQLATMQSTLAAQVAGLQAQQRAIVATIPKAPPPGTPPGTKPPPYVPPGPGWIPRGTDAAQMQTQGGNTLVIESIVINGVSDPEKAANLAVEKVEGSVKNGRIGALIDKRVKSLPK